VELLVAQSLIELRPFVLDLLARRIVGTDQQVADDDVLWVAQRRDGYHRREPAPVLAELRQRVDVLDSTCSLEDQSFEPRRNRGGGLEAQRRGARDPLLASSEL